MLTDYEGLAEVFSNIKRSTVLSREPEIVLHQVGYHRVTVSNELSTHSMRKSCTKLHRLRIECSMASIKGTEACRVATGAVAMPATVHVGYL